MKYPHPCVTPTCPYYGKMVEIERPFYPPKGQRWSAMNLRLGPPPAPPRKWNDEHTKTD